MISITHGVAAADLRFPLGEDDLRGEEEDDRRDPFDGDRLLDRFLCRSFLEGERPRSFPRLAGAAGFPCRNGQLSPFLHSPLAKNLQGTAERGFPLPGD